MLKVKVREIRRLFWSVRYPWSHWILCWHNKSIGDFLWNNKFKSLKLMCIFINTDVCVSCDVCAIGCCGSVYVTSLVQLFCSIHLIDLGFIPSYLSSHSFLYLQNVVTSLDISCMIYISAFNLEYAFWEILWIMIRMVQKCKISPIFSIIGWEPSLTMLYDFLQFGQDLKLVLLWASTLLGLSRSSSLENWLIWC